MKFTKFLLIFAFVIAISFSSDAKKYKWNYGTSYEVYQVQHSNNGNVVVLAWNISKNADKAIEQAKMDAVSAILFQGCSPDPNQPGAGLSTLDPLVSGSQYDANKAVFDNFFKTGEFLSYVSTVNSRYPTGQYNVQVPGGRRIGVQLRVNRQGLEDWLKRLGIKKGLDRF